MTVNSSKDELIDTVIGRIFDSVPIKFEAHHSRGHAPMLRHLIIGSPNYYELPTELLRKTFLRCCRDFTRDARVEHLIIGYGCIRGGGSDIAAVQHLIGEKDSVIIPDYIGQQMSWWFNTWKSPELTIFHSHPDSVINRLTGIEPLPSCADRECLTAQKFLNPEIWIARLFGGTGRYTFYVGCKGKVIEIRAPRVTQVVSFIQTAVNVINKLSSNRNNTQ
jgi:hypothetical protein